MADYSAYQGETGPADATADSAAYSMGLEFSVTDDPAWLTKIHFWQPTGNSPSTATRSGALWDLAGPTNLSGTQDFPATVDGWNTLVLDEPVELAAATGYKAVVQFPAGRYAATPNYYSTGAGSPTQDFGPLRIPEASVASAGGQNTFTESPTLVFPTSQFNANKYWIDVTVTDVDPGGGGAVDLAGTGADAAASSGTLFAERPLAAAAAAADGSTAALTVSPTVQLAALAPAAASASATVEIARGLAGVLGAGTAAIAQLDRLRAVAGATAAAATGGAALLGAGRPLAGSVRSGGSATGALLVAEPVPIALPLRAGVALDLSAATRSGVPVDLAVRLRPDPPT